VDRGQLRQTGAVAAGHGDQRRTHAFDDGHDGHQLGGFAGIRNGNEGVVRGYHAEVAVGCFGRVHEQRRGAGRGESGGDLATDMAGLADAGDHHATIALQQ